jgi:hypothetical protein
MTIRIRSTSDFEPLDEMIEFVNNIDTVNRLVMEQAQREVEPPFRAELETESPERNYPDDYPLEWESRLQQMAYFASNGFGKGIPYQRTGKLAKAWELFIVEDANGTSFVVENPADAARYVYGSLAQNTQRAARFQQRFHKKTGWQTITETVAFWLDAYEEVYLRILDEELAAFGQGRLSRRAYTSPS